MSAVRKSWKSFLYLSSAMILSLPVLLVLPRHAASQTARAQLVASIDPAESTIHWTLGSSLHTVHGTFRVKSGSLHIDAQTSQVTGEIVADATSGQSGNDGRDRKMQKEVLESARFGEIVFRADRITGKLAPSGASTVQLHGVFSLHGSEHELTVPVEADLAGDHWKGTARFGVPFIDWGLKDPSTWLLKVDHVVSVELELQGTLQGSSPQ